MKRVKTIVEDCSLFRVGQLKKKRLAKAQRRRDRKLVRYLKAQDRYGAPDESPRI